LQFLLDQIKSIHLLIIKGYYLLSKKTFLSEKVSPNYYYFFGILEKENLSEQKKSFGAKKTYLAKKVIVHY
jgi:hypothetical protein